MKKFESKLRSVRLRETPKSLNEKMDALFTKASTENKKRPKLSVLPVIAIAASLAIVAGILFVSLNNGISPATAPCDLSALGKGEEAPRIVVATLDSDISQAFGVGAREPKSFFASEKSKIRRLSFIRAK